MTRPRRLLFVCTANRLRSPTAEAICRGIEGIEAMSAGTNNDAEQPLTGDLIEWADVVERTLPKAIEEAGEKW